jgi:tetratricopeptide (TPR) repeat protein
LLLIALGVLQGVLLVLVVRFSLKRFNEPPAGAHLAQREAAPPKLSASTNALMAAPESGASSAKAAEVAPLLIDESGYRAPSCESLVQGERSGHFPGLAYDELRAARQALVLGKTEVAQRAYCKAVHWNAENASYHFELAQLLLLRQDGASAAEWSRKGLGLDPSSARGQALLGDALARVGEGKAARTAWLAAAGMNEPGVKQVWALTERNLKEGQQAERQRDYARAERAYRRAALLQPDNVAALRGWAGAFVKLGSPRLALVQAERSVSLAEKDAKSWLMLGEVQTALGNTAEARRALQRAVELGSSKARQRLKQMD